MKKLASVLLVAMATVSLFAGSYSVNPTPADLYDLDHSRAYSWGIDAGTMVGLETELSSGFQITKATLTISNIWDWRRETDHLFINLVDNPILGVKSYVDYDNGASDYFNPTNTNTASLVRLADWNDPYGGYARGFNLVIDLSAAQIGVLTAFITNSNPTNRADFGFTFDPDCHYFNDGVTFKVTTQRASVADGGMTLILLGMGLSGLVFVRRIFRI